jgi:hypothetical protein
VKKVPLSYMICTGTKSPFFPGGALHKTAESLVNEDADTDWLKTQARRFEISPNPVPVKVMICPPVAGLQCTKKIRLRVIFVSQNELLFLRRMNH